VEPIGGFHGRRLDLAVGLAVTAPDFPYSPVVGQKYTTPSGIVYEWNGAAWTIGFYDSASQQLSDVGDILDQIRVLLQDTGTTSGQYRYSTDSIILAINQCMTEMFRVRPDLFLEKGFVIPVFSSMALDDLLGIEEQYVSAIIYYSVGLVQVRDDEQNQDARAANFLKTFMQSITAVG
jgi:hypothetical protein